MNKIVLTAQVNADGILDVHVPVGQDDANQTVQVTVEPIATIPPETCSASKQPTTEAEKKAARARFERHFGAVNLGHTTGVGNEGIDADLARAYADSHEEG